MSDLVKRLRDCENYEDQRALKDEAADEIERLTKERDEQKERNAIMKSNMVILEGELREQLAACQKDAERYRWLREQTYFAVPPNSSWDAAIDAAMKEQRT